jgi:hypothetical protein
MEIKKILYRERYFTVDDMGNLYKLNGEVAKQQINSSGYPCVTLGNNCYLIHIIIATAFVPNPENKKFVNHKKGIKTDNRATELEWMTKSENELHSVRVLGNKRNVDGLRYNWENPIQRRKVDLYSMDMDFIKTFDSGKDTATYLNCTAAAVNSCLKLRNKSVKNHIVKYH